MFCYQCGMEIPDNAHFCPFCGEVLDKLASTPEKISLTDMPVSKSGLLLSLEGGGNVIMTSQNIRKEITLFIENLSSSSINQVELQLSGPSHVYITPEFKKFNLIESYTTERAIFTIIPKDLGVFTLNATLRYGDGDSKVVPFNLQVKTTEAFYQESLRAAPQPSKSGSFLAIALVVGFIAILLVGFGISSVFSSPSVGITMIVIGIIFFTIATQGKCFLCCVVCDSCDDCDCDC